MEVKDFDETWLARSLAQVAEQYNAIYTDLGWRLCQDPDLEAWCETLSRFPEVIADLQDDPSLWNHASVRSRVAELISATETMEQTSSDTQVQTAASLLRSSLRDLNCFCGIYAMANALNCFESEFDSFAAINAKQTELMQNLRAALPEAFISFLADMLSREELSDHKFPKLLKQTTRDSIGDDAYSRLALLRVAYSYLQKKGHLVKTAPKISISPWDLPLESMHGAFFVN